MPDVPVAPKRDRRWWVGLLVLVIAVGGRVWWCTRLTPEERVLVGHWQYFSHLPSGTIYESTIEFGRDRTVLDGGTTVRWAARNGQIDIQKIPTNSEALSNLSEWIQSGFKDWPTRQTRHGRVEIKDHDTVIITIIEDPDDEVSELKRIVEK
jgi:hypothetical protein